MKETELIRLAKEAREKAYTPYSNFMVGCALISHDDKVHLGCNVENAAYGPTNCAERTALFRAIADGYQPGTFKMMAVTGDTDEPITPCGICRQVMVELCGPDMPVILSNIKGSYRMTTVRELLPGAFTQKELEEKEQ